jgi:hypothetical protein
MQAFMKRQPLARYLVQAEFKREPLAQGFPQMHFRCTFDL